MFEAIKSVSEKANQIIADRSGEQCTLEDITNIVQAYTAIDKVLFVRYEASQHNPIWGEFQRWEQFQPYQGEQTLVEVRYANHLDVAWRRFVVCKELCHALDSRKGTHTVKDPEVTDLITELALHSASTKNGGLSIAGSAEKIAEAGAIEMLLPLRYRLELMNGGSDISEYALNEIATKHDFPLKYVKVAFNPEYIEVMQDIMAI